MNRSINVVVAHQDRLYGDAVGWRCTQEPDIHVVGTAFTQDEALRRIAATPTDVVVVGLAADEQLVLPDRLAAVASDTRVCAVAPTHLWSDVMRALRAGAHAALPLGTSMGELTAAIRVVADGQCYVTARMMAPLVGELRAVLRRDGSEAVTGHLAALTSREREVLALMVNGLDRAAIAAAMVVSLNTVGTHIKNVLSKLGAHSTLEAISIGLRAGIRPHAVDAADAGRQRTGTTAA
jgi:DNA-binding NarL/FixJ family response regulator